MNDDDVKAAQPLVTLSAAYGAGGSVVGPQVAERLGVPFLDRAIATQVAEHLGAPQEEDEELDGPRGRLGRFLAYLDRVPVPMPAAIAGDPSWTDDRRVREETEKVLAHAGAAGGVILGRGAAVVLRRAPGALHVRLAGAREARVRQAMEIENIDEQTAERRLDANDRAREAYVRRLYGVDPTDPALYHVIIDGPTVGTAACVDMIVAAGRARCDARQAAAQDAAGQAAR
jgi:cytidylate kinase